MPKMLKEWLARDMTAPWPRWESSHVQAGIINARTVPDDPGGVCFRLAFKWVACKVHGREFKFGDDPGEKRPMLKPDNVVRKQFQYLYETAPYERKPGAPKPKGEYQHFLANVDRLSLNRLHVWGTKDFKSGGGKKYAMQFTATRAKTLTGHSAFASDAQMVIGLYGQSDAGPWAHATAFFRRGKDILYFDANGGEFSFDPTDDIGALIQSDVARYEGDAVNYRLKDFVLYSVIAS